MDNFTSEQITELRVQDDPADPNAYYVLLPRTAIEAVTDPDTGQNLAQILSTLNERISRLENRN